MTVRGPGVPRPLDREGISLLRAFSGPGALLAFDLDGTLAPIVPSPDGIRIPEPVRSRMDALCRRSRVAVLTGRAVADARGRLGFRPCAIIGNHGAEGLPGRREREAAFAETSRSWEDQLRTLLPEAPASGIFIESKGATLSLHYRRAPDPAAAMARIDRAVGALRPPPRRLAGKRVENLVPWGAPLKGEALLALMRETRAERALFVGDDETDEAVFRLGDPRILGVRIGCGEASGAQWCIGGPGDIVRLLDVLSRPSGPSRGR